MVRTLNLIYSSTSGHTEYVVDRVVEYLGKNAPDIRGDRRKAEMSRPEDLLKGDFLLLACGMWNTGNIEGQLNPYMHDFLKNRAKAADLKGKPATLIGLGDERYHYTARSVEHLTEFIKTHGGKLAVPALKIVNEPYGQEEKIEKWAAQLANQIQQLPASIPST